MNIPFREKFLLIHPAEEGVEVGLGHLWPIELADMGMFLTAGIAEVPDLAWGSVVAVGRAPDRVAQGLGLVLVPLVADFIRDRVI